MRELYASSNWNRRDLMDDASSGHTFDCPAASEP